MKRPLILALVTFVSCMPNETPRPTASPSGVPTIQPLAINAHASEFEELGERAAGSQEEFAAATYITAHLQQAGYVVEFDSVPVANTVRSTNVVALPPSGQDPEYLVAVPYDGTGSGGMAAFLELARALRAAAPEHSVELVALGAQETDAGGGSLGARRLIALLQERKLDPYVIELWDEDPPAVAGGFKVYGGRLEGQLDATDDATTLELLRTSATEAFEKAGFEYSLVVGEPHRMAEELVGFLSDEAG